MANRRPSQAKGKAMEFNWQPTENQPLPRELVKRVKETFIDLAQYLTDIMLIM